MILFNLQLWLMRKERIEMTFTEENRIIREKQAIKMSTMTLKEKSNYVSNGAKQIQKRIEEIREKTAVRTQ